MKKLFKRKKKSKKDKDKERAKHGKCAQCKKPGAEFICGNCQMVPYCGQACQYKHWTNKHNKECGKMRVQHDEHVKSSNPDSASEIVNPAKKGEDPWVEDGIRPDSTSSPRTPSSRSKNQAFGGSSPSSRAGTSSPSSSKAKTKKGEEIMPIRAGETRDLGGKRSSKAGNKTPKKTASASKLRIRTPQEEAERAARKEARRVKREERAKRRDERKKGGKGEIPVDSKGNKKICVVCGKVAHFYCSQCEQERYCGPKCQTSHWAEHQMLCEMFFLARGIEQGQVESNPENALALGITPQAHGPDKSKSSPAPAKPTAASVSTPLSQTTTDDLGGYVPSSMPRSRGDLLRQADENAERRRMRMAQTPEKDPAQLAIERANLLAMTSPSASTSSLPTVDPAMEAQRLEEERERKRAERKAELEKLENERGSALKTDLYGAPSPKPEDKAEDDAKAADISRDLGFSSDEDADNDDAGDSKAAADPGPPPPAMPKMMARPTPVKAPPSGLTDDEDDSYGSYYSTDDEAKEEYERMKALMDEKRKKLEALRAAQEGTSGDADSPAPVATKPPPPVGHDDGYSSYYETESEDEDEDAERAAKLKELQEKKARLEALRKQQAAAAKDGEGSEESEYESGYETDEEDDEAQAKLKAELEAKRKRLAELKAAQGKA